MTARPPDDASGPRSAPTCITATSAEPFDEGLDPHDLAAGEAAAGTQPRHLALLVIEDDGVYRRVLEAALRRQTAAAGIGLTLRSHASLQGALADKAAGGMPDLIITDLNLPDSEGADTYQALREWRCPLVILTSRQDEQVARRALASGVAEFVHKTPDELLNLLRTVLRALERHRARMESRRISRQVARQQRILALGTMAAGIAHEFNNLHAILRGTLELMLRDQRSAGDRQRLMRCLQALVRADGITGSILDLVRDQPAAQQDARCRLDQAVRSTLEFLGGQISAAGAELALDVTVDPLWVQGTAGQLGQVLQNLCRNALQAMAGRDRRRLTIRVFPLGDEGRLVVGDSGGGIAAEHMQRIFEPFFTTKSAVAGGAPAGTAGTGLGLAVCDAIVRRHGGRIQVASRIGEGTTFTICLPRCAPVAEEEDEEEEDVTLPVAAAPPAPPAPRTGRVLVVDDEEPLRALLGEMVADLGLVPEMARNGREAMASLAAREDWAALLLDWHMPLCSGRDLLHDIGAELARRGIPVLVVTGLPAAVEREMPLIPGLAWRVVRKPFDLDAVEGELRRLLAAAEGTPPPASGDPGLPGRGPVPC